MSRRAWLLLCGGVIGGVGALDVREDRRHGVTLSQTVREVFGTHTPAGRAALVGSWAALTAVLLPHLLKAIGEDVVEAIGDAIDAVEWGEE